MPPLPRLRHGLSAGEALPEAMAEAWQAATGTQVHQALGLSECSTFISGSPQRPAPVGSVGFPQRGRRIAVLGQDGSGTLAVHCSDPGLMLGYYNLPEETAARFSGEWFLTGDQVGADAHGALRYLGRDDDMMNPGGYRVSPLEIEAILAAVSGVTDCAAVEVEIAPGNRIIACLYTSTEPLSTAALARHAARNLARYKQPRGYIRLDALPRSANNKLNRAALRKLAAAHFRPEESR
jgi:acyl-coenzyme A synthetase/AMP-(fatty) acid ligase